MTAPPDLLPILFGHNLWATRLLLERSRELSEEQFHRRFEIGPGSIHDTLRHIVGAMLRWADRIGGRTVRPSIEKNGRAYSVDEVAALLVQGDAELRAVGDKLTAEDRWTEIMEFAVPEGTWRFTRAAAMAHVLAHGVHHRAQVLNMRRQLGLPPLGYDLDVVEWECVETGQMPLE
ncbi:MAG TPA: DinB family protein [Phycisphaerae bacterium]|jgi:uncharacterized damage-inducible protein DinB